VTVPSINSLHRAWRAAAEYTELVTAAGWMAGRHDVSEFWQENLDVRRSYPSFNDALVLRRGATWPLAERGADAADEGRERPWAESAWFVASREVPAGFLEQLDESPLGAPVTFEFDGRSYSAGFLTNAITTSRLVHWVRERGLNRPLRVLEIGAGYGAVAHQLHQVLPIELYAVCDLPENLFLSGYYLPANLPEVDVTLIGADQAAPPRRGLAFTIPPFLELLGDEWDLIVNTYSFQEMTLRSVREYFAFAQSALADDGIFYSLNSHGKDGAGIVRPSDYPVEGFELLGFAPIRRFAFQALATHPYEIVLAKGGSKPFVGTALDALGCALQLGLHQEVSDLSARLSRGALTAADRRWLDAAARFFHSSEKRQAVDDLGDAAPAASAFLGGAHAYATGRECSAELMTFTARKSGSYAEALAHMMLCEGEQAARIVPYLAAEIDSLSTHPRRLRAHIGRLLGLPADQLPRRLPGALATMADAVRRLRGANE